ncbi:hypothetical protein ACLBKT_09280 [Erythrobacter sp. W302b]|uniref:hypothetical protein n=1 Tax=Erythrobacter sp. W302b TaxID=3389874 RepID=UPI00396AF0D5
MPQRLETRSTTVRAVFGAALVLLAAAGEAPVAAQASATRGTIQVPASSKDSSAPVGQAAEPSSQVPVAPASASSSATDAFEGVDAGQTAAEMEQYGSSGHIIFMVIGVLLALVAAAIAVLLIKRRRDPKASHESEELGMGSDNRPSARRGLVPGDHRDTVIDDLLRRVTVMEQRIIALENGPAMRPRPASAEVPPPPPQPPSQPGYGTDQQDNYYDRRREPQNLPEDGWPASERTPVQSYNAEPPRAKQPGAELAQQFAADLAEFFNRANKPDFDALATQYGAESFTNDRRGDLAQLIKDPNDRFWVVPVPGRPEIALMIPGFTVKKSWAKLRQPETDHPLAYHFELRRGDRLQVIKPAVLQRNSNNFWELQQKGEVVGIS